MGFTCFCRTEPSAITYTKGDATQPQGEGPKIICHVCNDVGAWEAGFVLAISRRWKQPEEQYRVWYARRDTNDSDLGAVQFLQVEPELWVANMVAQTGLRVRKSGPPVRYEALAVCLGHVATRAIELGASVHMPRIGCGFGGRRVVAGRTADRRAPLPPRRRGDGLRFRASAVVNPKPASASPSWVPAALLLPPSYGSASSSFTNPLHGDTLSRYKSDRPSRSETNTIRLLSGCQQAKSSRAGLLVRFRCPDPSAFMM
jgi:O-acetyl-ADP-ribose deacetylase (regulator of RNase III)